MIGMATQEEHHIPHGNNLLSGNNRLSGNNKLQIQDLPKIPTEMEVTTKPDKKPSGILLT